MSIGSQSELNRLLGRIESTVETLDKNIDEIKIDVDKAKKEAIDNLAVHKESDGEIVTIIEDRLDNIERKHKRDRLIICIWVGILSLIVFLLVVRYQPLYDLLNKFAELAT